MTQEDMTSFGY